MRICTERGAVWDGRHDAGEQERSPDSHAFQPASTDSHTEPETVPKWKSNKRGLPRLMAKDRFNEGGTHLDKRTVL